MPANGEINKIFGVYKTICRGCEIIIAEGMEFPDCPKHPKLTTIWKVTNTDLAKLSIVKKSDSAA